MTTTISDKELVKLALPQGGIRLNIIRDLQSEMFYAIGKFPPFRSGHEGLAIVEEEFEEFKKEVFRKTRTYPKLRKEAIHLATMAIRFVIDICDNR